MAARELCVLGMDYGAGSGRGMAGIFDGERLRVRELTRFQNNPVQGKSGLRWDVSRLYEKLGESLLKAAAEYGPAASVGIDSWAQDFGIIHPDGSLAGDPYCYRDPLGQEGYEALTARYSPYRLYSMTGMYPAKVCALFQLYALKRRQPGLLQSESRLLFIPNLLGYWLTGETVCDSTIPSLSLMLDNETDGWLYGLLGDCGIARGLLPDSRPHFSVSGLIRDKGLADAGCGGIPLITTAHHDTASAFAALSALDKDAIYISCGTWAVIGVRSDRVHKSKEAFDLRLCNERGLNGQIFLARNLTGLWIIQECCREWTDQGPGVDFDALDAYASAHPFDSTVDTELPEFALPGGMTDRIKLYCARTNQQVPSNQQEIYACVVKSLAVQFSEVVRQITLYLNRGYKRIRIVGGGSKNLPFCRLLSEYTGMEVVAGPAEATAVGNLVSQLIGLGELSGVREAGELISRSFPATGVYSAKK